MPKVSVIVPVYKVETLLPACLKSIEDQTFRDFELILVDDGSPDSCGAMCDEYAATHSNTRVLHQENMGLSEARNQGVKIATGEYVTFIDSDDLVTPDYIEYLLYLIEKYGTEVSAANMQMFWGENPGEMVNKELRDMSVPVPEALSLICYNKIGITAWGKLYKRYLVERYPYPKGQLYEDTATTYKIVGDIPAVAFGTKKIYHWRQRAESITHAVITERHLFGLTAAQEQLAYMQERYPSVVPAAQSRYAMKAIDLAYRLALGKTDKALFARIRAHAIPLAKPVLRNRKNSLSLKLRTLALRMGYFPHWLVSKLYHAVKGQD